MQSLSALNAIFVHACLCLSKTTSVSVSVSMSRLVCCCFFSLFSLLLANWCLFSIALLYGNYYSVFFFFFSKFRTSWSPLLSSSPFQVFKLKQKQTRSELLLRCFFYFNFELLTLFDATTSFNRFEYIHKTQIKINSAI